MAELLVVCAIIAVILAVSAPLMLSYLRTAALRGGAEELVATLANARQLAIKENTIVCVTHNATAVQFHVGSCAAAPWAGPGTDAAGWISLANNIRVTNGPSLCFNYLGASPTAPAPCTPGVYTVWNPTDGRTLSVIVAPTGRVRIGP